MPTTIAVVLSVLMVAAMFVIRLELFRHWMLPVGYGVPVVIVAYFRHRKLLWLTIAAFALLTIVKFFFLLPSGNAATLVTYRWSGAMVLADLVIVGFLADVWTMTYRRLELRNEELEAANSELAAREEEIARQNEELQSQTEELERQSEELRLSNDELARREKTLEVLLSLSRALTTELSRGDMMSRICETLSVVAGPMSASAILEQDGDLLRVRCHHGFGARGLREETLPLNQSFASLVLSRGRTGYLEDISLRPDLKIPRPAEGPPMVAVLAVPLRVGGWPIGTIEIFAREKMRWTDEQIALVESLAAQTSVSLEAAHLFETVKMERQRFETVLRTVPLALVVATNADASDIRVNPAAAVLFNVPADVNVANEIGRGNWQLYRNGRELPPGEHLILQALRSAREIQHEELELITPGGKRIYVLGNARPIRNDAGRISGAVAAYVDITSLKELQRELDLRRREAEEASVRKTRFLAAVSHDIRTPANAISLLAELVRRTSSNPAMAAEVPELARELQASSASLVNLLSDVLDIARFDSGRVELQETEFTLASLLEEEHVHLTPLARERQLNFRVIAPSQPVWLRADRIKLGRVIGNLVGNAIKFTESGEVVLEAMLTSAGEIKISVRDTGVGIAAEHLAHIFDEFFQLRNPERDRNKGTGLGLTICRRLVDAMGGTMSVESELGRGSVFTVTLPASIVVMTDKSGSESISTPSPPREEN